MSSPDHLLELRGISKSFPGVQALADVSLRVRAGEVHALLGENGAGKSTLLKILSGIETADSGTIHLAGQVTTIGNPKAARQAGIAMIHQELQQIPELDVAQNLFLGSPLTRAGLFKDIAAMRRRSREVLRPLDPGIDVATPIKRLGIAQRQIVEIAKALLADARIIAMDEPTSSLTPQEFERLVLVIAGLKDRGVGIIYVSHKLDEVLWICQRATILRDGRLVGEVSRAEMGERDVVAMMVGRKLDVHAHQSHARDQIVLRADRISWSDRVRDVSFTLHAGEILGVAGLVGAGRTELMRVMAGLERPSAGTIEVRGKMVRLSSPRQAIRNGIALLPEERKREGIVPLRPVMSNVALPVLQRHARNGLIRFRGLRRSVTSLAQQVRLRPPDIDRPIRLFSGGNQQKAIICRWLHADAEILIFDEPTRGIDVGAKDEIYQLIERLAAQGKAIIVVTSELPEILRLSDRVLVMQSGRATALINRGELSEEAIMRHAVPGASQGASPAPDATTGAREDIEP